MEPKEANVNYGMVRKQKKAYEKNFHVKKI